MYSKDIVVSQLEDDFGFRNSLSEYELLTDGTIFIDQEHPLVSVQNMYALGDFKAQFFNAWDPVITYKFGQSIQYDNGGTTEYYRAKYNTTANVNIEPTITGGWEDFWKKTNPFTNYLQNIIQDSITNVIDDVLLRKKINYKTKGIFDRIQLFDYPGRIEDKIIKTGRFVGLIIDMKGLSDLRMRINRIGLQIDSANTDLPIYLYHSSQTTPLQVINVSTTKPGSVEWISSDIILNTYDPSLHDKGVFYLGYYEDDLTGQAIRKEWSKVYCNTCNQRQYYNYTTYSKIANFQPFYVPSDLIEADRSLWDIYNNRSVVDSNFGLNLDISVDCDITQFIIDNKDVFSQPIKTTIAYNLIKAMAYNTLNSGLSEKVKQHAMFELSTENKESIRDKQKDVIKALSFDLTGLNSMCLAGERKGVRHRTA